MKMLKIACGIILLCFIYNNVKSQKLPKIQRAGLKAPIDLKIDGKADEWKILQAYNRNTGLYYSIANDSENLYLVVQISDISVIDKVLAGGITFSVNPIEKSSRNVNASITFPLISTQDRYSILHKLKNAEFNSGKDLPVLNQRLITGAKEIQITGIGNLDPMISVYNENGIHVGLQFDAKKILTYEIVVSLKYLERFVDKRNSFSYSFVLNGLTLRPATVVVNGKTVNENSPEAKEMMALIASSSDAVSISTTASGKSTLSSNNSIMQNLLNPTNFSGTYYLVK